MIMFLGSLHDKLFKMWDITVSQHVSHWHSYPYKLIFVIKCILSFHFIKLLCFLISVKTIINSLHTLLPSSTLLLSTFTLVLSIQASMSNKYTMALSINLPWNSWCGWNSCNLLFVMWNQTCLHTASSSFSGPQVGMY